MKPQEEKKTEKGLHFNFVKNVNTRIENEFELINLKGPALKVLQHADHGHSRAKLTKVK